jgi:hypothetical protein
VSLHWQGRLLQLGGYNHLDYVSGPLDIFWGQLFLFPFTITFYSPCFTSQPSGQKQDTRLALRHSYPAGSTVLVTSHHLDLRHNHQVGSMRCLITTTTPTFEEVPFGLYQAYLESAQNLHEIEAWSTHQQPVHPC